MDLQSAIKRRDDTFEMIDRLEDSRQNIMDKNRYQAKYNHQTNLFEI